MYWWEKCAQLAASRSVRRFGLITTNSIVQTFNRRVVERWLTAKNEISLILAIPDHPWVKSADKAAVRIAMTVASPGASDGTLGRLISELDLDSDAPKVDVELLNGKISSDLTIGPDVSSANQLEANRDLARNGMMLAGQAFKLDAAEAQFLVSARADNKQIIRPYLGGREVLYHPENRFVIDAFGYSEDDLRNLHPEVYQILLDRVYPKRRANRRKAFRERWWVFGEPRRTFRPVLKQIARFIVTTETSKHRIFQFFRTEVVPDHMLVAIGIEDAFFLGVLSSRIHVTWTLAAGGRLGVGNDPRYNKTRCFDPFPFPDPPKAAKARIRELGERLDAQRKEVLKSTSSSP